MSHYFSGRNFGLSEHSTYTPVRLVGKSLALSGRKTARTSVAFQPIGGRPGSPPFCATLLGIRSLSEALPHPRSTRCTQVGTYACTYSNVVLGYERASHHLASISGRLPGHLRSDPARHHTYQRNRTHRVEYPLHGRSWESDSACDHKSHHSHPDTPRRPAASTSCSSAPIHTTATAAASRLARWFHSHIPFPARYASRRVIAASAASPRRPRPSEIIRRRTCGQPGRR
ncbi:hypothetical protein B0J12DRAFT_133972 [Macrophomina phaseolina]|uniref:Uncharacterized protein n=1 Tax=Macrophomina phaseolina TaxID=35725 RepID=A0ABQ8G6U0_9PEZI|nr:hypothetical protein B0J12DRAFT_133972 [Macrophomina phaseolina]